MRHVIGNFEMLSRLLKLVFNPRFTFDDESWIEFAGREGLLYGEKSGQEMFIVVYPHHEKARCKLLYLRSIKSWRSPHETEPLNMEKQEEIGKKIAQFLDAKNYELEIS